MGRKKNMQHATAEQIDKWFVGLKMQQFNPAQPSNINPGEICFNYMETKVPKYSINES